MRVFFLVAAFFYFCNSIAATFRCEQVLTGAMPAASFVNGAVPLSKSQVAQLPAKEIYKLYGLAQLLQNQGSLESLSESAKSDLQSVATVFGLNISKPSGIKALNLALIEIQNKRGLVRALNHSAKSTALLSDRSLPTPDEDLYYMHRGPGVELLPQNHPSFSEPKFLVDLMQARRPMGSLTIDPAKGDLFGKLKEAMEDISPGVDILALTTSGSDANNLFFEIARNIVSLRLGRKVPAAQILSFSSVYGGYSGRMWEKSFLAPSTIRDFDFIIEDVAVLDPKMESKRQDRLEEQTLALIAKKVRMNDNKTPIGGILLEPIVGAKGLAFYRPKFLLKLQKLCRQLGIAIFADEVLTGGGRTGRMWAFQHYPGFQPQYISFGKGLGVSGIAMNRNAEAVRGGFFDSEFYPTSFQSPSALVVSTQILRTIKNENLIENAATVGEYFVKRLIQFHKELNLVPEWIDDDINENDPAALDSGSIRGKGLLVWIQFGGKFVGLQDLHGRLMPYLSMTKSDVDRIIEKAALNISKNNRYYIKPLDPTDFLN